MLFILILVAATIYLLQNCTFLLTQRCNKYATFCNSLESTGKCLNRYLAPAVICSIEVIYDQIQAFVI